MASEPVLQFKNPPIVEALLNIVVAGMPPGFATKTLLERFAPLVEQDYPVRENLAQLTATVTVGPGLATTAVQQPTGFVFRSTDTKDVVQARLDGLAVSRLAPYLGWEALRARLRKLWALYVEVFPQATPALLGARYINSISIPNTAPMEDYLTAYPEVPRGLPQTMLNFFYKVTLGLDEMGTLLTIQITPLPHTDAGRVNLLLDLDFVFPCNQGDDLWDQIDQIRPIKDRVFISSITPKLQDILNAGA